MNNISTAVVIFPKIGHLLISILDKNVVSNILDNVSDDSVGTPLSSIEGEASESPEVMDQQVVIDGEIISEDLDEESE